MNTTPFAQFLNTQPAQPVAEVAAPVAQPVIAQPVAQPAPQFFAPAVAETVPVAPSPFPVAQPAPVAAPVAQAMFAQPEAAPVAQPFPVAQPVVTPDAQPVPVAVAPVVKPKRARKARKTLATIAGYETITAKLYVPAGHGAKLKAFATAVSKANQNCGVDVATAQLLLQAYMASPLAQQVEAQPVTQSNRRPDGTEPVAIQNIRKLYAEMKKNNIAMFSAMNATPEQLQAVSAQMDAKEAEAIAVAQAEINDRAAKLKAGREAKKLAANVAVVIAPTAPTAPAA